MTQPPSITANLHLIRIYVAGFNGLAWVPVFFLWFGTLVSIPQVLVLEALYYAAVVALEVPAGRLSDLVGRVATLRIAASALLLAYATFAVAGDFAGLAVAQLLLATAIAFNSGTDAALHYDTLAIVDRADEFARREAAVIRIGLLASSSSAAVGGLVGSVSLRAPYLVAAALALVALAAATAMVEPPRQTRPGLARADRSLRAVLQGLRRPALRWLLGLGLLTTVLNHVPYELVQPWTAAALSGSRASSAAGWIADAAANGVPSVTGALTATALLLAAWAAPLGPRLAKRIGTALALLLPAAAQTAIIAVMGATTSLAALPVVLLRTLPRGLMTAPYRDATLQRVPAAHRATWLSIESLLGRLSFAAFLATMSGVISGGTGVRVTITPMLAAGAMLGLIGTGCLFLARGALDHDIPRRDEPRLDPDATERNVS